MNDLSKSKKTALDFFNKLKKINTFIFDVDGVLTNGTVLTSESGELLRSFNIKDGYALQLAAKKGYHLCIISGGKGDAMSKRFENLSIVDVNLGISNKVDIFEKFLVKKGIQAEQVLYMGDDIPDLPVMKLVGLATCPADAVEEIKAICHYISPKNGGEAAVRDVIEKVLKLQDKWCDVNPDAAESSI